MDNVSRYSVIISFIKFDVDRPKSSEALTQP